MMAITATNEERNRKVEQFHRKSVSPEVSLAGDEEELSQKTSQAIYQCCDEILNTSNVNTILYNSQSSRMARRLSSTQISKDSVDSTILYSPTDSRTLSFRHEGSGSFRNEVSFRNEGFLPKLNLITECIKGDVSKDGSGATDEITDITNSFKRSVQIIPCESATRCDRDSFIKIEGMQSIINNNFKSDCVPSIKRFPRNESLLSLQSAATSTLIRVDDDLSECTYDEYNDETTYESLGYNDDDDMLRYVDESRFQSQQLNNGMNPPRCPRRKSSLSTMASYKVMASEPGAIGQPQIALCCLNPPKFPRRRSTLSTRGAVER